METNKPIMSPNLTGDLEDINPDCVSIDDADDNVDPLNTEQINIGENEITVAQIHNENEQVVEQHEGPADSAKAGSVEATGFDALGSITETEEKLGDELHDEIVVRWHSYLQNGIGKTKRKDLMDKYPIPKNCLTLKPPEINPEVLECLDETTKKHDTFVRAVQEQIGHALSALGITIDRMIRTNCKNDIQEIADASQLLTNTHNALSVHRRYKIVPHMNSECKKAVEASKIDRFLFGENLTETLKTTQELKKASGALKKRQWTIAGSFSTPKIPNYKKTTQQQRQQHSLNSERSIPKSKMKDRRGEDHKLRWRRQGETRQGPSPTTKKYHYRTNQ